MVYGSNVVDTCVDTRQVDYSNAFVQADIDEEVYCDLPLEFCGASSGDYGLKQAPRYMIWDSRRVKMIPVCL